MKYRGLQCALLFFSLVSSIPNSSEADEINAHDLASDLLFHASFDKSADADTAKGDGSIYTGKTLERKSISTGLSAPGVSIKAPGKWGNALTFANNTKEVVFFKVKDNLDYQKQNFQGTVSLWMRLTPDADLKPGYVDPIQITDKKWNDASFFLDFTKDDNPRQFRLGIFSDYKFWNPTDTKWEEVKAADRPMAVVKQPPFNNARWTHVAWTFRNFNQSDRDTPSEACLYLDGKLQGKITKPQQITWNPDEGVIMLGIAYIGGIDDLATFGRALSADEIALLVQLPHGVHSLNRSTVQ